MLLHSHALAAVMSSLEKGLNGLPANRLCNAHSTRLSLSSSLFLLFFSASLSVETPRFFHVCCHSCFPISVSRFWPSCFGHTHTHEFWTHTSWRSGLHAGAARANGCLVSQLSPNKAPRPSQLRPTRLHDLLKTNPVRENLLHHFEISSNQACHTNLAPVVCMLCSATT